MYIRIKKIINGTLFGCLIFLFGSSTSKTSSQQIENTNLHHNIDSLIQESKQYYNSNSNSIPVFDPILKKAYSSAKEQNNQNKIGLIFIELGKRQRNNSEFAKAINYIQQAISISEKTLNDELHAKAAHELAVVFRRMGDNTQAHSLYIEALEWSEMANDTFLIHCSLNGIGNIYFHYEDYTKAIEYFHRSLNYLGKTNRNLLGEAINTNTLGESWLFLHNFDSALFYLNRSFKINEQIGSELGKAICYNGIGMVHHANGEYYKAIESFKSALAIDRKKLDLVYVSMCQTSLGKTYITINNYAKAELILKESFEIASSIGSRNRALQALTELTKLYKATNQPLKALEYIQTSMAYKDSINDELIQHNSEAMSILYKAEKQEREILILKQNAELDGLKLSHQRNTFLAIFTFILITVLFVLGIYRQRRLQSQIKQVELEQQLFRTQLNPHFIFNSLAALQNFFMQNDKMAASDYLANFSRLMRNILLGSRNNSISLETELELLEDYLKLQQLRFNNAFDFKLSVDNTIDSESCTLPPMLVQPFIENAIEHGIRNLEYNGQIVIEFKKEQQFLTITVDDNGRGFIKEEQSTNSKHVSLATKITQERLANIQKLTKNKCSLEVQNKKDVNMGTGVRINITIPYQEQ